MERRDFLRTAMGVGAGLMAGGCGTVAGAAAAEGPGAAGLKAAPIPTVRIGMIGVGARGGGHLGDHLKLEGTEIKAICDIHEPAAIAGRERCVKAGKPAPELYTKGPTDYLRMLERPDLDLVVIATPWELHTPQAVAAMKAGKHAVTEVPAAVTLDECWELVETAEKTRRHCMMLENVCYGREELMALNMCRMGVLGELLHGEAAYIHELRGQMNQVERGTGSWRTLHYARRNGNLYPTHGLGPVAQYMNINRGDRFDYLSSVSSPALGRAAFAKAKFPPDHKWNKIAKWNCGDMNTTIIKTALGRSIMVQWDETSPRPYSRHNLIQGTRGTFAGFPNRLVIEGKTPSTHGWVEGDALKPFFAEFDHPLWKRMSDAAKGGGHGGMDFIMNWRVVYCLRNGEPLDQDVYDAASWSSIGPLSEKSVAHRSDSVDVPDFTRGRWKTTPPLAIIS
jgi:predicted dehydrogenase